jgi:hypothetical protein
MATYFVSRARSIGLVLMVLLVSAPAAAQGANDGPPNLQHATMLSGFVGAAPAGSTLAPAAGGAIGWQLVPRFGLEARGYWLQPGAASNAFAATVALRVRFDPARASRRSAWPVSFCTTRGSTRRSTVCRSSTAPA